MIICLCGDTENKKKVLKELKIFYKDKLLIVDYFTIKFRTIIETESIKYKLIKEYKDYNIYDKLYSELVNKLTNEKINNILDSNKNKIIILVADSILRKDLDETEFFNKSDLNILSTDSTEKYDIEKFDIIICKRKKQKNMNSKKR